MALTGNWECSTDFFNSILSCLKADDRVANRTDDRIEKRADDMKCCYYWNGRETEKGKGYLQWRWITQSLTGIHGGCCERIFIFYVSTMDNLWLMCIVYVKRIMPFPWWSEKKKLWKSHLICPSLLLSFTRFHTREWIVSTSLQCRRQLIVYSEKLFFSLLYETDDRSSEQHPVIYYGMRRCSRWRYFFQFIEV